MPFKTVKQDAVGALTLEWGMQVKNYKLTLDKKRCVGCQICSLACPKEAIKTQKQPKTAGEKAKKAKVDIDLAKCNFCGICDVTCPYGAVKVTLNGKHDLSILAKDSYPTLTRDIQVDATKAAGKNCQDACPLGLITVSQNGAETKIDIAKEYCPTCRVCEFKCSPGSIKVKKAIEGLIAINQAKCPEGCQDCLDVCPIPGALTLGEDKKVHVNEAFCTYCGACKNVCPVDEALSVKRTVIHHTPIHSGTWNKALERLTSPTDAAKEFRTVASGNRQNAVFKRFNLEENEK